MNFYEVKVEYTRQTGEDNPKSVKESYMTEEVSFGRAEQLVHDYLKQYAADLVTTLSMKILKVYDKFQMNEGKAHIYCGKVKFITIEDNGTEKSVTNRVYVGADSLSEAKEFLHEQYKGYDAKLVGIEETKMLEFVDVFPAVE